MQQVDRRLGLSEAVARTLDDPRRQASIDHDSLSLLRQRVYALALGYEDLNDHETLRLDLAIQTARKPRPENTVSGADPRAHVPLPLTATCQLCQVSRKAERNTYIKADADTVEQPDHR